MQLYFCVPIPWHGGQKNKIFEGSNFSMISRDGNQGKEALFFFFRVALGKLKIELPFEREWNLIID